MANEMVAPKNHGTAWAIMKGDSMSPTIERGEWVEIDPSVTKFQGPGIYLTDFAEFEPKPCHPHLVPQFRRLAYINGELHSVSDNPSYPPFKVNIEDLLIGGKVIGR